MAGIIPTFQKLNLLLSKKQAVQGTKEAALVYTDFVTVDDTFSLDYKKEFSEQSLVQGILGQPQRVGGVSSVEVKVSMPIIPTGDATPLPNVDPFLRSCGLKYALATKKHTYTPKLAVVTDYADMTLWGYTGDKTASDSVLTKCANTMFDAEITGEVGKPAMCTFTGKGVPDGVPASATYPATATALIAAVPPAILKNCVVTINGGTFSLLKFSVKTGNDVQLIKSAADESGYLQAMITGVKSAWSATVYMVDASTAANNPLTGMAAGTLATTSIKFGAATDSLISIVSGASKSQITECKQGADNGIMTWELAGIFVDNDYLLTINDAT